MALQVLVTSRPLGCESVDGLLAYGPIGEPQPLPLTPLANGNCASGSGVMQVFGIRTAACYGFVWSVGADSCLPWTNLFSLNLDPNFEGGGAPLNSSRIMLEAVGLSIIRDSRDFIAHTEFFNSHFRPEQFPIDPVISSGRITEAETIHERDCQCDWLKAADRLDELLTDDREWSKWKWVLTPFGAIALLNGMALVFATFWAMVNGGH